MFQKIRERAINEKMRETFFDYLNHYKLRNVCLRGEMATNLGSNHTRKIPEIVFESSTISNECLFTNTNAKNIFLSV